MLPKLVRVMSEPPLRQYTAHVLRARVLQRSCLPAQLKLNSLSLGLLSQTGEAHMRALDTLQWRAIVMGVVGVSSRSPSPRAQPGYLQRAGENKENDNDQRPGCVDRGRLRPRADRLPE